MTDNNSFYNDIYEIVKQIPRGRVLTYKQAATLAGYPGRARMAGRALGLAPAESGVPCHRVVNSQGRTAPLWPEQRRLLEAEGIVFKKNGCVDMTRHKWNMDADL